MSFADCYSFFQICSCCCISNILQQVIQPLPRGWVVLVPPLQPGTHYVAPAFLAITKKLLVQTVQFVVIHVKLQPKVSPSRADFVPQLDESSGHVPARLSTWGDSDTCSWLESIITNIIMRQCLIHISGPQNCLWGEACWHRSVHVHFVCVRAYYHFSEQHKTTLMLLWVQQRSMYKIQLSECRGDDCPSPPQKKKIRPCIHTFWGCMGL